MYLSPHSIPPQAYGRPGEQLQGLGCTTGANCHAPVVCLRLAGPLAATEQLDLTSMAASTGHRFIGPTFGTIELVKRNGVFGAGKWHKKSCYPDEYSSSDDSKDDAGGSDDSGSDDSSSDDSDAERPLKAARTSDTKKKGKKIKKDKK